jgi:hypothetical protein
VLVGLVIVGIDVIANPHMLSNKMSARTLMTDKMLVVIVRPEKLYDAI